MDRVELPEMTFTGINCQKEFEDEDEVISWAWVSPCCHATILETLRGTATIGYGHAENILEATR